MIYHDVKYHTLCAKKKNNPSDSMTRSSISCNPCSQRRAVKRSSFIACSLDGLRLKACASGQFWSVFGDQKPRNFWDPISVEDMEKILQIH